MQLQPKQSIKHIAALFTTLIVAMVGGQRLMFTSASQVPTKPVTSPSESAYLAMARATEQLAVGRENTARALLDGVTEQDLIVLSGATGAGALETFSPSTVLMRLGRTLSDKAMTKAGQGERADALAWVRRCQALSEQVLRTSTPTLDALNTARYLDSQADRAEAAVYAALGERERATLVRLRREHMNRFWMGEMIADLKRLNEQVTANCVQGKPETDTSNEQQAATLLARYESERTSARIAFSAPPFTGSARS